MANQMINKKIIFIPLFKEKKEVIGIILDKYTGIVNGISTMYHCDYYLVEVEDGTVCTICPEQIIKIIKDDKLNQQQ